MLQQSRLQRNRDNQAFPIRIKVRVPPEDGEAVLALITVWLRQHVGRGEFALHRTATEAGDALAIHVRRIENAVRLLKVFPELALADHVVPSIGEPLRAPRRRSG